MTRVLQDYNESWKWIVGEQPAWRWQTTQGVVLRQNRPKNKARLHLPVSLSRAESWSWPNGRRSQRLAKYHFLSICWGPFCEPDEIHELRDQYCFKEEKSDISRSLLDLERSFWGEGGLSTGRHRGPVVRVSHVREQRDKGHLGYSTVH